MRESLSTKFSLLFGFLAAYACTSGSAHDGPPTDLWDRGSDARSTDADVEDGMVDDALVEIVSDRGDGALDGGDHGPCRVVARSAAPYVAYPEVGEAGVLSGTLTHAVLALDASPTILAGACDRNLSWDSVFRWHGSGQKTGFPLYFVETFFDPSQPAGGGSSDDLATPAAQVYVTGPPDIYEIWLEVASFPPWAGEENVAEPVVDLSESLTFEIIQD